MKPCRFGSLLNLGAALGCAFGGALAQSLGRRRTLSVCSLGFLIAWVSLHWAPTLSALYVGRFGTGFFCGITSLCVPTYIAEVSLAKNRGTHVSEVLVFRMLAIKTNSKMMGHFAVRIF